MIVCFSNVRTVCASICFEVEANGKRHAIMPRDTEVEAVIFVAQLTTIAVCPCLVRAVASVNVLKKFALVVVTRRASLRVAREVFAHLIGKQVSFHDSPFHRRFTRMTVARGEPRATTYSSIMVAYPSASRSRASSLSKYSSTSSQVSHLVTSQPH